MWGAAADTSFLTRFRLTTSSSTPAEPRFDSSSVPVSALIVNGVPNLASAMQLITVNGPAATYLKGTRWEHSIKFEVFQAPPNDNLLDERYSSVRMAVTAFEGQTTPEPGEPTYPFFTDLKLDGRLSQTLFPGAKAFKTSRERGNYDRLVQQSSEDVSAVDMRVSVTYIHEGFTQPVQFLTGLFDDIDHSARGFLTDGGQVNQFDKDIRDEWFNTFSTARGSTRTSNDYMIGVQTGSRVTLDSFKTSVKLGASLPVRATYPFPVNATFCAGLVLTAARAGTSIIVGSSLTTLNHLGEGIPYFTPAGSTAPNTCRGNLDVEPNSAEDPLLTDFTAGFSYNLCVVFKNLDTTPNGLPPNTPPPADVCATTLVN